MENKPASFSVNLARSLNSELVRTRRRLDQHHEAESSHSCQDLLQAFHQGHHRLPPPYPTAGLCLPHLTNISIQSVIFYVSIIRNKQASTDQVTVY